MIVVLAVCCAAKPVGQFSACYADIGGGYNKNVCESINMNG